MAFVKRAPARSGAASTVPVEAITRLVPPSALTAAVAVGVTGRVVQTPGPKATVARDATRLATEQEVPATA